MLTLLITLPVVFIVIGPLATFGSTIVSEFVFVVRDFSPLFAGLIVGGVWKYWLFLVLTRGLYLYI
ncbi:hypothetical protein [Bacillus fungorum]|uniref:hypothetical protein n=1 Tax=Bacillus fungorum TaxID=2039284 RepID=UPI001FEB6C0C|nr:hypothetical protein [Bacillus fungorum]